MQLQDKSFISKLKLCFEDPNSQKLDKNVANMFSKNELDPTY